MLATVDNRSAPIGVNQLAANVGYSEDEHRQLTKFCYIITDL